MADKKKDQYVELLLHGIKVRVPRGDMSDADWEKVVAARDAQLAKDNAETLAGIGVKDEPKSTKPVQQFDANGNPTLTDVSSKVRDPENRTTIENVPGGTVEHVPAESKPHGIKAFIQAAITGAKPTAQEISDKYAQTAPTADAPPMPVTAAVKEPDGTVVPGTEPTPPADPTPTPDVGAGGAGGGPAGGSPPTLNPVMDGMESGLKEGVMQAINPLAGVGQAVKGMTALGQAGSNVMAGKPPDAPIPPRTFDEPPHPGIAAGTHHPPLLPGDIPLLKHPLSMGPTLQSFPDQAAPFDAQKAAVMADDAKNKQAVQEQAQVQMNAADAQDRVIAAQQKKQEWVSQFQQQRINELIKISHKLQDPSMTVDPNRYWANHNKTLFAIGVALTAGGGGDTAGAFARVHAGIQDDIQAQKDNIANRRESLTAAAGVENNILSQLRGIGLDSYEQMKGAEAIMLGQVKLRTQAIASKYDQDLGPHGMIVRKNAADLSAKIDEAKTKATTDMIQHMNLEAIQAYDAQTHRMAEEDKINKPGGVDPKLRTMIDNADASIRTIDEIMGHMSAPGMLNAAKDSVLKNVPLLPTDAKAREQAIQMLKARLAGELHGGVLREGIQKLWLGDPEKNIKGLLDAAQVGWGGLNRSSLKMLRNALLEDAQAMRTGGQPHAAPFSDSGALPSEQPVEE